MALPLVSPEISYSCDVRCLNLTTTNSNPSAVSNRRPKFLHFHGKYKGFKSEVRVHPSRMQDLETNVLGSELGDNMRPYGQISAPVKPDREEEEKRNFYLNVGYAIRTLREELPDLFHRELTLDIYRDDMVFKDPKNTFFGIDNYRLIFWGLRFHGRMLFRAMWVDIIRVWQPADDVVVVRWTVHGIPRVFWEGHGRFDGTSEYHFDKYGKIFEHRVDNMALNSQRRFRVLNVGELIQSVACPSTPKPTYFEWSSSASVPLPLHLHLHLYLMKMVGRR
ncbi:hypothetical protein SAY87_013967 [Trapa incisa]|uniref:NTF2-like domain-containing protein n=1 Tax=Trapa incisa TaxID=236973 RepID=A0AAN7JD12_9MYRT|nr:hypothetical protein SAY87_013967 [Trapa incisa]